MAEQRIHQGGLGNYLGGPPPGAATPPRRIYRTAALTGPMPAGRWWSSAAVQPFSDPMYPHPLAALASERGLELDTPSVSIGVDEQFKSHSILAEFVGDLTIAAVDAQFEHALVDAHSDWSVSLLFEGASGMLRVTLAHGSPFAYVTTTLVPRLLFATSPDEWAVDGAIASFRVNDHHYAAFLPHGSEWTYEGSELRVVGDASTFSVAALPDATDETLRLFASVAHNHITSTAVVWRYDEEQSLVHARYDVGPHETLIALYPHHLRALDGEHRSALTDLSYRTVRGTMRVLRGSSFSTTVAFPGALPLMPKLGNETDELRSLIAQVEAEGEHHLTNLMPHAERDMYWTGVSLGRISVLVPIAERVGADPTELTGWLKRTLESHFRAATDDGELKDSGFFWWDDLWSTVIGFPGGFGADTDLNDHHYQYAYWIRAAVEIARRDPAWIDDERWGEMVRMLVSDIATYARDDPHFPFVRNFDVFAGHSWATGIQKFPDGANSESSSEAIAAWAAVLLWAELTADRQLRDFAAFLYATEISAADEYWFDVHGENFMPEFDRAMAGQVWGGKTSYSVWWTDDPEPMRGISFLPLSPTSFYLGRNPGYVRDNLADLRRLRDPWSYWPDILWCYEALADPDRALALRRDAAPDYTEGHSESRAHTLSWILDLATLGTVDCDVVADTPCYAVFRSGDRRTYVAFNFGAAERVVRFSDGATLPVPPNAAASKTISNTGS